MIQFIKQLIKPKYDTLNVVKIKADNLLANFNYLSSLQERAEIFPVLKSNAYGHGLKEVCQILDKSKAKMLAVDSYPEAQIAYKYFKGKVLIIGEMPLKAYSYTKINRSEFVVYSSDLLKYLSRYGKKANIHLFYNSGMNREGIGNIDYFLSENKEYLDKVNVVGFCSHLASADTESEINDKQKNNFFIALEKVQKAGYNPKYVHLGNSAAVFTTQDERLTAFRPGLAFYGYSPFSGDLEEKLKIKTEVLRPALEIYSKIISIQKINEGDNVSYNESFEAKEAGSIGIIPFGYFEGLDRRFSNEAIFEVLSEKPFYAKIAGKVCMNLSCLDLGQNKVKENDFVRIISMDKNKMNFLPNMSRICGGSIYECLIRINANIRREVI